jgi:hypothetical protein
MILKWKRRDRNHTNGHNGYIGGVKVFCTEYSINRDEKYVLYSLLPNSKCVTDFQGVVGNGEEDDLMEKAEKLIEEWLEEAGLEVKG